MCKLAHVIYDVSPVSHAHRRSTSHSLATVLRRGLIPLAIFICHDQWHDEYFCGGNAFVPNPKLTLTLTTLP